MYCVMLVMPPSKGVNPRPRDVGNKRNTWLVLFVVCVCLRVKR